MRTALAALTATLSSACLMPQATELDLGAERGEPSPAAEAAALPEPEVIELGATELFDRAEGGLGQPLSPADARKRQLETEKLTAAMLAAPAPPDGAQRLLHYDATTKSASLVTLDAALLERLTPARDRLVERPVVTPAALPAEPSGALMDKVWSGGIDNRQRFAIQDGYPSVHPVFQSIGSFRNGGTGTLFTERLALTAAHVIVAQAGAISFAPRRNASTTPFPPGSAVYGDRRAESLYFDWNWLLMGCHQTNTPSFACLSRDWALVVFASNAWTGRPIPMGVAVMNDIVQLSNAGIHHKGYPLCDDFEYQPAGCSVGSHYLWGNLDECELRSVITPGDSEPKSLLGYGCDSSNGHSGGPIYILDDGDPVLVGHHLAGGESDDYPDTPNVGRLITQPLALVMVYFAQTYP